MKRIGLLSRIIIAILLGILIGSFANEFFIRIFATFNGLFGNFLSFIIPFIIIGFIAPGIGTMGRGAGKLLGISAFIAYVSTILAGILAFVVAKFLYPPLLSNQSFQSFADPTQGLTEAFITIEMPAPMDVTTSLLLAFILGIGLASLKGNTLLNVMNDFREIVQIVIERFIIPLLPFHIFGIFANMTYTGQVATILSVFLKVFIMIVLLHWIYMVLQYSAAGTLSKQNPFKMLKTMLPAYFTALGTQSSAATIPVSLKHAKQLKTSEKGEHVIDFTIPLFANIHLSGSTITIVSCSLAVLFLQGDARSLVDYLPFILMLGITMVAAPGIPGGAVMAAIGLLESMLGFGPTMVSLMIALYLAQDSFGTATNVTGDGALAIIVDTLSNRGGSKN